MSSGRVALSLLLLGLALLAGVASGGLAAAASDPTTHLAVASLGIESFIALVALACAALSRAPLVQTLGLGPGRLGARGLLLLVLGILALSHGLDGVLDWSGLREHSSLVDFDANLVGARGWPLALALLGVGLAPGLAEELLCRGLVQNACQRRWGPLPALLLASLFFGALHVEPIHAAFAVVLGLYLGAAALLAGSIRASILCHGVNNVMAVSLAAAGSPLTSPASTLASLALAAACLWAAAREASAAGWIGRTG